MQGGRWFRYLLLAIGLHSAAWAQTQYAVRISFTDKEGSADINNPLSFLSQRALDRRAQQGVAVDETDLPVSPDYIDSVLTAVPCKLHVTSRWLNSCVVLMEDIEDTLILETKPFISKLKYVGYYQNGLHKGGSPEEELSGSDEDGGTASKTTSSPAFYGHTWSQTDLVKGDCLHDQGLRGEGKLIAILDDGFLHVNTNRAFNDVYQSRIIDHYNFVLDEPEVYAHNAHGTQALSTMAAYLPDTFVGAAPMASYALYITEDQGSEQPIEMDNMVAGMERADSVGADIISSSLGYNFFTGPVSLTLTYADLDGKSTVAAQGVNMASAKGILCVITAGNDGGNSSFPWILTPGDADSALTIGNVNSGKLPHGTSGHGPNSAGKVKPEICVLGNDAAVLSTGVNPLFINGTSFATSQAAGFAACLWQGKPGYNSSGIKSSIVVTGHTYSSPGIQLGYGVPDFCVALDVTELPGAEKARILVYPNPLKDQLQLSVMMPVRESMDVALMDITGKNILQHSVQLAAGHNSITIPINKDIQPGIYFARITIAGETQVVKLVRE